jgi:hypothetical protein
MLKVLPMIFFARNFFKNWLLIFFCAFQIQIFAGETSTNSTLSRVVMIGASASAGFVLAEPFGGTNTLNVRLGFYLDAAIAAPHEPIKNFASAMTFLNPEMFAPVQVQSALAARPTLVIGVDFLFWFCYGYGFSDAERAQRFETGLKLLEKFQCPIIVGDIPDASFATNSGILQPEQVPGATALVAANTRLKNWAAQHAQVFIVPLAKFMRAGELNQSFTVHGETLPAGKTRALLQPDLLHPTPRGATLLAFYIWDNFIFSNPKISADNFFWDKKKVLKLGLQLAKSAMTNQIAPPEK